jgi:hypothetical protein
MLKYNSLSCGKAMARGVERERGEEPTEERHSERD